MGRTEDCNVPVKDGHVSRRHLEAAYENGAWQIRDLNSGNGLYVNGERVTSARVTGPLTVRLGIYGPFVEFESQAKPESLAKSAAVVNEPAIPVSPLSSGFTGSTVPPTTSSAPVKKLADHYFGNPADQSVGDHTRMVRRAFAEVQTKQKRKYTWVIAVLAVCAAATAAFGLYEHMQAQQHRALAQDLFYSMKSLDVSIANVEKMVAASGNPRAEDEVRKDQARRKSMADNYNRFLASLHVYDPKMSEQDRLVLRVARIFGECELAMPPDFLVEVQRYIKMWQSSGRFLRAVRLAKENGYTGTIARDLLAANLPPQFFYLAMQESDFNPYISGPMTHMGIAKGMWQFIPQTAVKYGLQIGPLVDLPRPDTGDDRHHWERETKAAAAYMKDLYSSDAQASGLLVMACYNWGEKSVLPLVRSMPANPRERNFWKLLSVHRAKIPEETYNYVFYITSAAVIGENPRLFGIDSDNPLAALESK